MSLIVFVIAGFSTAAVCQADSLVSAPQAALGLPVKEQPENIPDAEYVDGVVKWASFDVPYEALDRAMQMDIRAHEQGKRLDWIELLAITAAKLYGNWRNFKTAQINAIAKQMMDGEEFDQIKQGKTYKYFYEVYSTVLKEFLGEYTIETPEDSLVAHTKKYALKAFLPIAAGYSYGHYDDFGDSRSFGYKRRHLGHDMMGSIGTPIIAVEGGTVEELGWNRYGGWRVGIRSFDKKRYYYYAHLRKGRPFAAGLAKGDTVVAGDVIGYLGMSGYSGKEDTNNINVPHLHFGLQLIFDQSQKESNNEIWIDVYNLVKLLEKNRSKTTYNPKTKEHKRKYNFVY